MVLFKTSCLAGYLCCQDGWSESVWGRWDFGWVMQARGPLNTLILGMDDGLFRPGYAFERSIYLFISWGRSSRTPLHDLSANRGHTSVFEACPSELYTSKQPLSDLAFYSPYANNLLKILLSTRGTVICVSSHEFCVSTMQRASTGTWHTYDLWAEYLKHRHCTQ